MQAIEDEADRVFTDINDQARTPKTMQKFSIMPHRVCFLLSIYPFQTINVEEKQVLLLENGINSYLCISDHII